MKFNPLLLSRFLKRLIFVLLNILLFTLPFIFTWNNQELFEFNKMLFLFVMTVVLVSLWLLRMVFEQKLLFKRTPYDFFILAFLLSQVLATVFSIHFRTSVLGYYSRFNGSLLSFFAYTALFYLIINNISKKQLTIIFESILLAGFLVSLYAIPEHFGYSPSCWLINRELGVDCWKQEVQIRVFASFGQPNWLASFLITLIPLNLSLLLQKQKFNKKLFLLINTVAMTLALLYTRSRSGLIGLGVALVLFLILHFLFQKKEKIKVICQRASLPIAAMFLTILLAGSVYSPKLTDLWQAKNSKLASELQASMSENRLEEGGSASSEIRKVVWNGAIKIWQRYPLFGSGVETFAYSYYLDRPVEHNLLSEWNLLYNKAHNELLNFLATTGLFGLLSYLGLFAITAYLVLKKLKTSKTKSSLIGLSSALAAMFVANFFGFSTVSSNLLLFSFFAFIVLFLGEDKRSLTKEELPINSYQIQSINLSQFFILGSIILLSTLMISKLSSIWLADYFFTQGKNYYQQGKQIEGVALIEKAIEQSPSEALFYDELASKYADLAVNYAEQDATVSTQLASSAIALSDQSLKLNDRHLNFYKSRASIFIKLGQLDPQYYIGAKISLQKAISLAPTDARLYYNLALIEDVLGEKEQALKDLEYAVKIKANYAQARNELANFYLLRSRLQDAQAQYQYLLTNINPEDELVKEKLRLLEASLSAKNITK